MSEMSDFSLADLAGIDVSDIEEIRFVSIPAGVYDFLVNKAELLEEEKDGETRFKAEFELKIVDVHAVLEPGIDKETLINKLMTERFFIKKNDSKEDVLKSIGRIRAFISDIGQDSTGLLGDIVRNSKDHAFKATVVKQQDKNDKSRSYARLKLDPKK